VLFRSPLDSINKSEFWQQLESNFEESSQETKEAEKCFSNSGVNNDKPLLLKPYLVKTFPHYHFDHNKIGIRLQSNTEHCYPKHPAEEKAEIDLNKPLKLEKIPAQLMQPDFWISPPQMLHISFYHYLYKNDGKQHGAKSIDILLSIYRAGITRLFNSLREQLPELAGECFSPERHTAVQAYIDGYFKGADFKISLADLPKVLINALLGAKHKAIPQQQVINRVEKLIESTEQKQRQLDSLLNAYKKRGHKDFKPIKCGYIGDFLTDDIIRFQPIDNNLPAGGKLNSQQYQILQKTMAYYGKYIDEAPRVIDLFKDYGLLDGDYRHPFLYKLGLQNKPDKYRGLLAF